MNQLVQSKNEVKTMLSTEIAELTGKLHNHVLRDIDVIIDQLQQTPELDFAVTPSNYAGLNGQKYKCYELDLEATMVVLTGYDVVARTKVIKRWMELEETVSSKTIARDFGESAKLGNSTLTACGIVPDRFNVREFVLNDIGFDLDTLLPKLEVVPKAIEYQLSPSKRNPIDVLANGLGVPVKSINHVLYMEGYLDISYIPTRKAFRYYDYVNDEVCWSLPLVMRLLKEEGYKIR